MGLSWRFALLSLAAWRSNARVLPLFDSLDTLLADTLWSQYLDAVYGLDSFTPADFPLDLAHFELLFIGLMDRQLVGSIDRALEHAQGAGAATPLTALPLEASGWKPQLATLAQRPMPYLCGNRSLAPFRITHADVAAGRTMFWWRHMVKFRCVHNRKIACVCVCSLHSP